jgi:hypothetical protein
MDTPSVGRIVHYVAYGTPGGEFPAGVCRAAVITDVVIPVGPPTSPADHRVSLMIANPTGLFFSHDLRHDEDKTPGTWHWPERR